MTRKSFIFSALSLFSILLFGCGTVSYKCQCGCKACEAGCSCSPDKKCDDKNCHCDR